MDAKDPLNNNGTSLPADNSLVTKWYDKSGHNNHAVAANGVPWTAFNNINNQPSFMYNNYSAIGSYFTNNTITITGSTITVFAVVTMTNSSATNARIIGFSTNSSTSDISQTSGFSFARSGVTSVGGTGIGPNRASVSISSNTPPSNGITYLTETWADGSFLYAIVQQGNTTVTTPLKSSASTGNFNINYYSLGYNTLNPDATSTLSGYIQEIVVYNTCLSQANRQLVEGYLSWKWNLQGKLPSAPSAHPFYSSPPPTSNIITNSTITSFYNISTIYCASQLAWTYSGAPFNVDIYRNNLLLVSNYSDSSIGLYIDINLTQNTQYKYDLYATGNSATILATVTFTTPAKPSLPLITPVLPSDSIPTSSKISTVYSSNAQYFMATNYNGSTLLVGNLSSSNTSVSYSTNGGSSFTTNNLGQFGFPGFASSAAMCMNWAGNFMYVLVLTSSPGVSSSQWACSYSFNSGLSWSSNIVNGLSTSSSVTDTLFVQSGQNYNIKCNHIGNRILVVKNYGSTLAISYDYGQNYTVIYSNMSVSGYNSSGYLCVQPDFSKVICHTLIYMAGNSYIYGTSTDFGATVTWTPQYLNSTINTISSYIGGFTAVGYDTSNNLVYCVSNNNNINYASFSNPSNNWSRKSVSQTSGCILYDPSGSGFALTSYTNAQISSGSWLYTYGGDASLHMSMCVGLYQVSSSPAANLLVYSDDKFATCRWRLSSGTSYINAAIVSRDGATIYYIYSNSFLCKYK